MSAGMGGNSILQEQMNSCVSSPDFKQSQKATLCSLTTSKAGRCSPSPKVCYDLYFLAVCDSSSALLHPANPPPLHLPGTFIQGRASAQPAGLGGIPVRLCSLFFSFYRTWAREGSGKDSLVFCYPDLKDFSFLLSCIAGEEPQPESSLCARPVLGHCTQQEKALVGVLRNSHFHRLESVPNFWFNNNIWEDPKCCAFALH